MDHFEAASTLLFIQRELFKILLSKRRIKHIVMKQGTPQQRKTYEKFWKSKHCSVQEAKKIKKDWFFHWSNLCCRVCSCSSMYEDLKFPLSWWFYFSYLIWIDFCTTGLNVPLHLLVSLVLSVLVPFCNHQLLIYLVDLFSYQQSIIRCFDLVSSVSFLQLIFISCCAPSTSLIWSSIELISKRMI